MDELHGVGERRKSSAFERESVARVERLAAEAAAGHSPRPENLEPLEWELHLVWAARTAQHEATARQSTHEMSANIALLVSAFVEKPQ